MYYFYAPYQRYQQCNLTIVSGNNVYAAVFRFSLGTRFAVGKRSEFDPVLAQTISLN